MKTKLFLKVLTFGLAATFNAHASLTLSPTYPDLTSFSMSATYTATCSDSNGLGSEACGTSTKLKGQTVNYDTFDSASLVLSSNLLLLNVTGSDGTAITNPSWTLIADFSDFGIVSSATLNSTGTLNSGDFIDNFSTANIVNSSALTAFDFSGQDTSGILQFTFNSATGDLPTYAGDDNIGVITGLTSVSSPLSSATWTTGNIWQQSFTASGSSDTFAINPQLTSVPVPPSALFFLTGLFGLFVKKSKI